MCGIAGLIGRLDDCNRAALKRMSDAMVHRGPDANGTWISAPDTRGWGALLAHRRLSILDLSPAGAQHPHPAAARVAAQAAPLRKPQAERIARLGPAARLPGVPGADLWSSGATMAVVRRQNALVN